MRCTLIVIACVIISAIAFEYSCTGNNSGKRICFKGADGVLGVDAIVAAGDASASGYSLLDGAPESCGGATATSNVICYNFTQESCIYKFDIAFSADTTATKMYMFMLSSGNICLQGYNSTYGAFNSFSRDSPPVPVVSGVYTYSNWCINGYPFAMALTCSDFHACRTKVFYNRSCGDASRTKTSSWSRVATQSQSLSAPRSMTISASATLSVSDSETVTASWSRVATQSQSLSMTQSATISASASASVSASGTVTASWSGSATQSRLLSTTQSATISASATLSVSKSETITTSWSGVATQSQSLSMTQSATISASASASVSDSGTVTASWSGSSTQSQSLSAQRSMTISASATASMSAPTSTRFATATSTSTLTASTTIGSASRTATTASTSATPTPTSTSSVSASASETSQSPTRTPSLLLRATETPSLPPCRFRNTTYSSETWINLAGLRILERRGLDNDTLRENPTGAVFLRYACDEGIVEAHFTYVRKVEQTDIATVTALGSYSALSGSATTANSMAVLSALLALSSCNTTFEDVDVYDYALGSDKYAEVRATIVAQAAIVVASFVVGTILCKVTNKPLRFPGLLVVPFSAVAGNVVRLGTALFPDAVATSIVGLALVFCAWLVYVTTRQKDIALVEEVRAPGFVGSLQHFVVGPEWEASTPEANDWLRQHIAIFDEYAWRPAAAVEFGAVVLISLLSGANVGACQIRVGAIVLITAIVMLTTTFCARSTFGRAYMLIMHGAELVVSICVASNNSSAVAEIAMYVVLATGILKLVVDICSLVHYLHRKLVKAPKKQKLAAPRTCFTCSCEKHGDWSDCESCTCEEPSIVVVYANSDEGVSVDEVPAEIPLPPPAAEQSTEQVKINPETSTPVVAVTTAIVEIPLHPEDCTCDQCTDANL